MLKGELYMQYKFIGIFLAVSIVAISPLSAMPYNQVKQLQHQQIQQVQFRQREKAVEVEVEDVEEVERQHVPSFKQDPEPGRKPRVFMNRDKSPPPSEPEPGRRPRIFMNKDADPPPSPVSRPQEPPSVKPISNVDADAEYQRAVLRNQEQEMLRKQEVAKQQEAIRQWELRMQKSSGN